MSLFFHTVTKCFDTAVSSRSSCGGIQLRLIDYLSKPLPLSRAMISVNCAGFSGTNSCTNAPMCKSCLYIILCSIVLELQLYCWSTCVIDCLFCWGSLWGQTFCCSVIIDNFSSSMHLLLSTTNSSLLNIVTISRYSLFHYRIGLEQAIPGNCQGPVDCNHNNVVSSKKWNSIIQCACVCVCAWGGIVV